jgi:hypothetical protein
MLAGEEIPEYFISLFSSRDKVDKTKSILLAPKL